MRRSRCGQQALRAEAPELKRCGGFLLGVRLPKLLRGYNACRVECAIGWPCIVRGRSEVWYPGPEQTCTTEKSEEASIPRMGLCRLHGAVPSSQRGALRATSSTGHRAAMLLGFCQCWAQTHMARVQRFVCGGDCLASNNGRIC